MAALGTFTADVAAHMGLHGPFKPLVVRSDQGSAFVSYHFREFLTERQIKQSLAAAYTPQQSSHIERFWGIVFGTARVLLAAANLPPSFHPFALQTSAWIANGRVRPTARNGGFEPKVRVVFQYGHDHEDHFTYKMQWSVPLQLKEVVTKFYKPPGWKEGGSRNRASSVATRFRTARPSLSTTSRPRRLRRRCRSTSSATVYTVDCQREHALVQLIVPAVVREREGGKRKLACKPSPLALPKEVRNKALIASSERHRQQEGSAATEPLLLRVLCRRVAASHNSKSPVAGRRR